MKDLEKFIELILTDKGSAPIHNCIVSVSGLNSKDFIQFKTSSSNYSEDNLNIELTFKIGSITKIFTATIVLQLYEEGLLELNASFLDYIKSEELRKLCSELMIIDGINYTSNISLKNLLNHSSGLRCYFADDEEFINNIINNPNKYWNKKLILKHFIDSELHKNGLFKPGNGFHYSDLNYALLAMVTEELTGQSFHEVLENRILNPLYLNDTYLEYYQNKKRKSEMLYPYYGPTSLEKINTSFDWGGGGLVSSYKDLNTFFSALFNGELFKNSDTLDLMMNEIETDHFNSENNKIQYGLGLQKIDFQGTSLFGHYSAYGGMAFHSVSKNITFILNINQIKVLHKAEWLFQKVLRVAFVESTIEQTAD